MSDEQGCYGSHVPASGPTMRNGHWCSDVIDLQHDLAREQERSKALAEALRVIRGDAGSYTVASDDYPPHTGFGFIYRTADAALERSK